MVDSKSKADSFQPKTPAMKAWKNKFISDEESDDEPTALSTPIEKIGASLALSEDKKLFATGFFHPLKVFLPLSIISFLNESINGSFCFGGWDCARAPSYYPLPKLIALFSTMFFLFAAIVGREEEGDSGNSGAGYSMGIVIGVVVGVLMFLFFTGAGWAS